MATPISTKLAGSAKVPPDPDPLATPAIALEVVSVQIGDAILVNTVSCAFGQGEVIGLIGQNGSGKSTLLRVLARQQTPTSGRLLLNGEEASSESERVFARQVAYLPQHLPSAPGMTVRELVKLGRYPWHGALGRFTDQDKEQVTQALAITATDAYAQRMIDQLSGGERQRCWLAMMLAQAANVLLLDEPISALDIRHQVEVLRLIRRIAATARSTVVVVIHDVNLAARYCDRILALKGGHVVMDDRPDALMTPDALSSIYDASMHVLSDKASGERFAFAADTDGDQQ